MLLFLSRFFFSNSNFEHERDGRCYGFLGFLGGASLRPLAWKRTGWNCWKPLGRGTKWYATCATCKRRAGFVPCLVVANSLFPIILSIVHAPFFNSTISQDRVEKYMINREIKIRENLKKRNGRERERKIGANAFINSTRKLEKERKECLLKRGIVDFPILLREILLVPFVK